MRLAPGGSRSKVLWLLHFLESWYNQTELVQRARKHTEAIILGRAHSPDTYYLTEAFVKTGQLDLDTEYYLIRETKKLLQELDPTLAKELSPSDKEIFEKAEISYRREDYETAVFHFLEMKYKNDQIYFWLGDSFTRLEYYPEAIEYFERAVAQENVDAMLHLGCYITIN